MQGKIDLHLHTNFSDGTFSPEEVVAEAHKKNYSVISICDHDCIDGIEPAVQAGMKYGIKVIPGVEITAERDRREIHILGYFIDHKDKDLKEQLLKVRESREKRIYDMVEKLKEFDITISAEAVFKLSEKGSVGRPHLARVLVKEGLVASENEAFNKYIGDKAPCYVAKFNLTPEEAIDVIRNAGGIAVYAHPKVVGRDDFITGFVKAGLRGIEVYHPDHTSSVAKHYEKLALENNLLITGGSDFHGKIKENVIIGTINIPQHLVEELEHEAKKIHSQR